MKETWCLSVPFCVGQSMCCSP
uniref:Uncharacterized protein n=1 Tax=Anguilla anguilla TaxID=7936 RepID=A0A0E9RCA8_ANGAN